MRVFFIFTPPNSPPTIGGHEVGAPKLGAWGLESEPPDEVAVLREGRGA